jgi:carboxypeptidase Taq
LHEKRTDPQLGSLIESLWSQGEEKLRAEGLNEWQIANIRDARRDYLKQTRIPKEIVEKMAQLSSRGYQVWVKARESNDFALFAPILTEWIALKKEASALIDASKSAYDVCLDEYERGLTTDRISLVFADLKAKLVPLLKKIIAQPKVDDSILTKGKFDLATQTKLSHQIAKEIGFNTENGRLDVSVHPFTGGPGPYDVRMTTRYREENLLEGLTGTVHETGHALYEQGRNSAYRDLPVSEPLSMGVHESQSLLWERMVALSRPFTERYWPVLQGNFKLEAKSNDEIYKAFNAVLPGLIRVEADEVSYPMHIILRFEIERDLFAGTLKVENLPTVWNAKMKEYLGIDVPSNKLGVLQDIHWSGGAFGYFPSYTLGAIYACQIFHAAKVQLPELDTNIREANFAPLRKWLNVKIHERGSLYDDGEKLLEEVTGRKIDIDLFIRYLTEKYSKIYGF